MTQERNNKEKTWVNEILEGSKVKVDGHFHSKIKKQIDWLRRHNKEFGEQFIKIVIKLLWNLYDEKEDY